MFSITKQIKIWSIILMLCLKNWTIKWIYVTVVVAHYRTACGAASCIVAVTKQIPNISKTTKYTYFQKTVLSTTFQSTHIYIALNVWVTKSLHHLLYLLHINSLHVFIVRLVIANIILYVLRIQISNGWSSYTPAWIVLYNTNQLAKQYCCPIWAIFLVCHNICDIFHHRHSQICRSELCTYFTWNCYTHYSVIYCHSVPINHMRKNGRGAKKISVHAPQDLAPLFRLLFDIYLQKCQSLHIIK